MINEAIKKCNAFLVLGLKYDIQIVAYRDGHFFC